MTIKFAQQHDDERGSKVVGDVVHVFMSGVQVYLPRKGHEDDASLNNDDDNSWSEKVAVVTDEV